MAERILVVGADAAGMSAAHQALRSAKAAGRDIEVVALERTQDTSYSACGIPYVVAGLVVSTDDLSVRGPAEHRALGVDLRMGVSATGLDLDRRVVTTAATDGSTGEVGFDQLVLATGAEPLIPSWATDADGALLPGVRAVKTLDDARYWLGLLASAGAAAEGAGPGRRRGLVVGGGYIGVEMAEALCERGFDTTLVTRSRVMSTMGENLSSLIEDGMRAAGVRVITGTVVDSATVAPDGTKRMRTGAGETIDADVVLLGVGVRPNSDLGRDAGLPLGKFGGYLTDDRQYVADGIWAAGDCCEVVDRMRGTHVFLPLGTHANKQGKVCGYNVVGGDRRFAGALGTAITRFHTDTVHLEISRTGLTAEQATAAGFDPVSMVTEGSTASGYMVEHAPITTNVVADRATRRLLGVQIVGGVAAGKRIDTAAAALWGEMTVDDLAEMDLAYAPPFATVWEAIQIAARRLADRL